MDASLERQLTVILHADVVNSTDLVRANDIAAHTLTQSLFQTLDQHIVANQGTMTERRGDAVLATFSRASDAIAAATKTQLGLAQQDSGENEISLRIGITLGEVIIANGTMTGAGVIMAQRLEQLAEPGGVVVQAAAAETVPDHLQYHLQNVELHNLKGFVEPVRVQRLRVDCHPTDEKNLSTISLLSGLRPVLKFRWRKAAAITVLSLATVVLTFAILNLKTDKNQNLTGNVPSLAVLPFKNLSKDESKNYLSDGMTEELITDLSALSGLFVIARSSVQGYQDRMLDPSVIAQALNVKYLINGQLQNNNSKLSIDVELIDAEQNLQIWTESFEGDVTDLFELQNDIAEAVVTALDVSVTPTENKRLSQQPTQNLEAYNLYQQGRSFTFSAQRELGNNLLRQAIELDPGFHNAYAALAYSHATIVSFGQTTEPEKVLDTAFRLATKAVAIDNQSAEANVALALIFSLRGKHSQGLDAANRAINSNPGYAAAHAVRGWILNMTGEFGKALDSFSQAVRLQPKSNAVFLAGYGAAYYLSGRIDEALVILEESASLNPNVITSRAFLAATYQQAGRTDDAAWEAEEVVALNPEFSVMGWGWIKIYQNKNDQEFLTLLDDLSAAGLPL